MGEESKEGGGNNGATSSEEKNNMEEKMMETQEGGDKDDNDDTITVLKVDMHCEACAKKVVKALTGFQGVENVAVDRKTNKVVVKGKNADPTKLCQRIQKKSGRKAQILISPLPTPPDQKQPNDNDDNKHGPNDGLGLNQQVQDQQPPQVITVVLGVRMHCEACAQVMWKRIRKIKGVESVEIDMAKDQVRVKGVIGNPMAMVEYVRKRTRKQASLIAVEDELLDKKSEEAAAAATTAADHEEKQESDNNKKKKKEDDQSKQENNSEGSGMQQQLEEEDDDKMMMRSQMYRSYEYYWPTTTMATNYSYMHMDHYNTTSSSTSNSYNHHPQLFSDENPNACSIL